jgi:hypothetical protein
VFKFEAAKSGFFNFPYIWHFTTYIASWLKIFLISGMPFWPLKKLANA